MLWTAPAKTTVRLSIDADALLILRQIAGERGMGELVSWLALKEKMRLKKAEKRSKKKNGTHHNPVQRSG